MGKKDPDPAVAKALLAAELAYTSDPEMRPVEHFHAEHLHPLGQPLAVTRQYASEQMWAERRAAFLEGVKARWLREGQMHLLNTRRTELVEAQDLRGQIYEMLKPRLIDGVMTFPIQPRSLEGLVQSFIRLDDMIESKREAVLSVVNPMLDNAQADAEQAPTLPFSGDEMRRLAHQLLQSRRKTRRAQMDGDDDATEAVEHAGDESGPESDSGGVEGKTRLRGHQRSK
ncbi:MAG: hypothetical protein KJN79_00150 [Gammaproteobacteria bacterium]|nr:hypothetical protein [Gammaproteobacteria bacterium]